MLEDGDFEQPPIDLVLGTGCRFDNEVAHGGQRSLRVDVAQKQGQVTNGSCAWEVQDYELGETYTMSFWVRCERIESSEGVVGYGYVAMYQYDQFGDYVKYHDIVHVTGQEDWQRHTYTFTVGTDTTSLKLPIGIFQGAGTLWVDDMTLVRGEAAFDIDEVQQTGPAVSGDGRPGIAILQDDFPELGAPSDPVYLKRVLDEVEGAPYRVDLISAEELADRHVLSANRYDLVILPYGPCFPAKAAKTLRRFLRAGGDFLSMGGYAFDHLVGLEETEPRPEMPEESSWHYRIPVTEELGRTLKFRGNLRCKGVTGSGFAYLAVYQFDAEHEITTWRDTIQLRGDQGWTPNTYTVQVDKDTNYIDIKVGLFRCTGTASFDDISLTDEQGRELVTDPGFEDVTDPDTQRDHAWYRTQKDLASVTPATALSGEQCAKAKLAAATAGELIMNTARGEPGDSLKVSPEQIGVFDPQFPLKRVTYAKAAPEQFIVPDDFVADAPMEGWAATSVLGHNDARRVSLVNAYDGYDRLRGSVGSITYRYAGQYPRSAWAVFGSTDFDFFPEGAPGGVELLTAVVDGLVTETFLHNLGTNYASYRQGESVGVTVKVSNFGRREQQAVVDFTLFPGDGEEGMSLKPVPLTLAPGETEEVSLPWSPGEFRDNFYRIEASLEVGGRLWDLMKTGFCVWDEKAIAAGPDCVLEDDFFRLNGREHFLQGTDSFSFTFSSAHENPLVWKRDFSTMRDQGMNLPENLQIGPTSYAPHYEWPEDFLRKTDAMVQLCQQHGQVYMPGLLIGQNTIVEDDVLEKQAAWVQAFVERYAKVPGILWYINGDFRCDLADVVRLAEERGGEVPRTDVERLWNEFLRRRYPSNEELREAWGEARVTGTLGSIPLENLSASDWHDIRAVDLTQFKHELMLRWINRHVAAIREVDAHHCITSEYYRPPTPGVDIAWCIGDHDCANIGYFDGPETDIVGFPASMRFADLRARGKSMSAGEFGCKTHPAWGDTKHPSYHAQRTDEEQEELWLAVTHYGWGLGASKIHDWSWKDNVEWIFPWGMVYPGDWVKKDCLDIYRASGLLFRQFEREYREPPVYVLTPDRNRLGWPVWSVWEATMASFYTLQQFGVDMGTLNECALEEIPESAQAIFYPVPYEIPDDVYGKLKAWVEAGGTLYVSGDVSYDHLRQRTLTERLTELCGVEFVEERYRHIDHAKETQVETTIDGETVTVNPCIVVEARGAEVLVEADGMPVLVENRLGKGRVFYSIWPLERDAAFAEGIAERNGLVYRRALKAAGEFPERALEASGDALPITTPLKGGGQADLYMNPTDEPIEAWTRSDGVELTLAPHRSGAAIWGAEGELLAFEDGGGAHYACYSFDRRDVRESKQLCLLPMTEGRIRLETRAQWDEPVAVVGDVVDGKWVEYERLELRARAGRLRLPVDEVRMFSILIVTEAEQVERCVREVEGSLANPR